MMGQLLLISLVIVGMAVVGLSVRILFHPSHEFTETDTGRSPAMRQRGIKCPRVEDAQIHAQLRAEARQKSSSCHDQGRGSTPLGCAACLGEE